MKADHLKSGHPVSLAHERWSEVSELEEEVVGAAPVASTVERRPDDRAFTVFVDVRVGVLSRVKFRRRRLEYV